MRYKSQKSHLTLVIVPGDGPTLLGRNCLCKFQFDWPQLHTVFDPLEEILGRHADLFKVELDKIMGATAKLLLKLDA